MATKTTVSRREMILKTLRSARRGKIVVNGKAVKTAGGWVDGAVLGGDAGLRRLRELRADGLAVEKRYNTETGRFEYRLGR
jgi:hypothetical protein